MRVELTPRECGLLLQFVEAEIRELGPEIHHTRTYKDPLKEQRRELQNLRERLARALPDEMAAESFPFAAGDLLGTP